ncbi:hypothetical protein EXIGLDRAFT_830984 [Exidia glandulosa HHB12029]|uniref:Uncharacterized protein n=1 Tax=Exidia glandulosa HHB12029 TaxID=1314781 RepID=A0A165N2T0_EXIGL|nr:hypothetical protein EXIGLDRAFT_830984 [Exidia glandulosa HHB12029]
MDDSHESWTLQSNGRDHAVRELNKKLKASEGATGLHAVLTGLKITPSVSRDAGNGTTYECAINTPGTLPFAFSLTQADEGATLVYSVDGYELPFAPSDLAVFADAFQFPSDNAAAFYCNLQEVLKSASDKAVDSTLEEVSESQQKTAEQV